MWIDPWGWAPCQPYEVGRYKDLKKRSVGDDLDIHHIVQGHPAKQILPGYQYDEGIAIALPRNEHKNIPTLKGSFKGTPQELLDRDISLLSKHTKTPQSSIDKIIDMHKSTYQTIFK